MASLSVKELYLKNPKLQHDVILLREWCKKEKDVPKSSDLFLYLCLNSCSYNFDKTKEKIKSFYKQRKAWPAVFNNRDPSAHPFREQLDLAVIWPLNETTPEGYKIVFIKIVNSDASIYDLEGQLKLVFVVFDYWARLLGDGQFVLLVDHDGFTWSHLPKYRLGIIKKYIAYSQEALPIVVKRVHFLHLSSITQTLFKVSKIFMNKETRDLLYFHYNVESLCDYIPQSCLPKNLGGNDVFIADLHRDMVDVLLAHSNLFKEEHGNAELYG